MHYKFTAPPLPNLRRWRYLYRKFPGNSVLRVLEYEKLQSLNLVGKFLDVGGGSNARYARYLPNDLELESINIDAGISPTHLLQPGQAFPVADNSFDGVICLNTLEHIFDIKFVLDEIHRVLRPRCSVQIAIPFIFRIHGHPDDFHRPTPSWWREALLQIGYAAVELQPLVWGRYTSAAQISGYRGLVPARLQFHWSHIKDVIYAKLMFRRLSTYSGRRGDRICGVAPGWFISAKKAA